ncbi:GTP 3',8-cyclase MoaA [Paenibacillus sp. EPM92]|uniref:GTP 3',8-cyclase MoaA n=1 Tax=Paenibacillus sp. EPM92 TaxID=1561195 RepID=UPI001F1C5201|nr:GTP 3',8-cyclase MoaA [Paenibacillus sp. EPM92]
MAYTKVWDRLSRPLRDLRISVTDKCNFRCRYCMPEELFGTDYKFLDRNQLLSFQEIIRLVHLFADLGVEKIRITGGEPLLRPNLPQLIQHMNQVQSIRDISLTTNGSLLAKYAGELKEAGLKRITVSLDSLDDERFGQMNGKGFRVGPVLQGIDEAARAGLQIKINMVVQNGINEQDILPMARYFREKGHIVRFIEFMDVGNSNGWRLNHVVPSKKIVELIHREMPLEPLEPNYVGEVASRYRYLGSNQEIGFISSVTQAFCSTCTRARLSAEGSLYTCLFGAHGTDLRTLLREGVDDDGIKEHIMTVWKHREDRYSEMRLSNTLELNKKKVEMFHIGG